MLCSRGAFIIPGMLCSRGAFIVPGMLCSRGAFIVVNIANLPHLPCRVGNAIMQGRAAIAGNVAIFNMHYAVSNFTVGLRSLVCIRLNALCRREDPRSMTVCRPNYYLITV